MSGDEREQGENQEREAHDATGAHEAFDAADISDIGPEASVDASLRNALEQMRDESRRITELSTGDEQVEAAEHFVEAAGKLDERIGSHARAEDERGR